MLCLGDKASEAREQWFRHVERREIQYCPPCLIGTKYLGLDLEGEIPQ